MEKLPNAYHKNLFKEQKTIIFRRIQIRNFYEYLEKIRQEVFVIFQVLTAIVLLYGIKYLLNL